MHELALEHGYSPHIRARGEEIKLKAHTPGWRARRWVVEATHSWKRRCAADEEQTPVALSAFHCIPVRKTSRIASIASRSGTRGR